MLFEQSCSSEMAGKSSSEHNKMMFYQFTILNFFSFQLFIEFHSNLIFISSNFNLLMYKLYIISVHNFELFFLPIIH